MSFLERFFEKDNYYKNPDELPDFLDFSYEYKHIGYTVEGPREYFINVKVEFMWNMSEGMYEVDSYATSPDTTDVEIPDYSKFENDVNHDLQNNGINPIYIPDMDEWNFY